MFNAQYPIRKYESITKKDIKVFNKVFLSDTQLQFIIIFPGSSLLVSYLFYSS